MNVPLYDGTGIRIYRELMHRESKCAANWHVNYGPAALQKKPDPQTMINLGKFSKFASVPMPLDVQLRELQKEKNEQAARIDRYEKDSFPKLSDAPVSQMSVDIFGADQVWHSQEAKSKGAPNTYVKFEGAKTRWNQRRWDVDHMQHVREGLGPAHVNARLVLAGESDIPTRATYPKASWEP